LVLKLQILVQSFRKILCAVVFDILCVECVSKNLSTSLTHLSRLMSARLRARHAAVELNEEAVVRLQSACKERTERHLIELLSGLLEQRINHDFCVELVHY